MILTLYTQQNKLSNISSRWIMRKKQVSVGMVTTLQILHVYILNLARWILDICQIQNQWNIYGPNLSRNRLCKANIFIKNHSGLQIVHPNRFKMDLESESLLLGYWNWSQISSIALKFTCARIYVTDADLEKCVHFVCLALQTMRGMDTEKHNILSLKLYLTDVLYGKIVR